MANAENPSKPAQFEKLKQRWADECKARQNRSDALLKRLLQNGQPIFERYGIRKVVLFGSVVTQRCESDADIDILVSPLSNKDYWRFQHDLEEAVDHPVDIYTDHDDPVFVGKILARGKVIYDV